MKDIVSKCARFHRKSLVDKDQSCSISVQDDDFSREIKLNFVEDNYPFLNRFIFIVDFYNYFSSGGCKRQFPLEH